MSDEMIRPFLQAAEDAGCKVTHFNMSEPQTGGLTVEELIAQLQRLPQSWAVLVRTEVDGNLETWSPVTGWEAGGGEVMLLTDDEDEGED